MVSSLHTHFEHQEVGPAPKRCNDGYYYYHVPDMTDEAWAKLTADGGAPSRCGWLKDKFGLSLQIIPSTLGRMLSDKDSAKAGRAMNAMLQMDKLDMKRLQQAFDGA